MKKQRESIEHLTSQTMEQNVFSELLSIKER